SAAFFMVLAAIIPGAKVAIEQVSLNPSRSGIINILKRMNANIKIMPLKKNKLQGSEPIGNIIITSSKLKNILIDASEIPSLIDELPILMVAACYAQGKTIIKGVGELRVKETDRINSMVSNLGFMGADIEVKKNNLSENLIIKGRGKLHGASLKSFGDHRTAMSMIVAALAAEGSSRIDDVNCISKSFPGFLATLNSLLRR
ncbi:MAG: 3-phosphoshikimate 1-carboxyvinyltransferase, partial [Candidatus Omnitrophota bacterium]|nr:3-phosphoshikimate 1-carboxyvinyltransferase [Candidatus Omnitrophota bacterium]